MSVFVMDLLGIVPYYTAPFCQALKAEGVDVALGSIDYRCDRNSFARHGMVTARGIMNLTPKVAMPQTVRRPLKFIENILNLLCLASRVMMWPPDVVHVQFLYLIQLHIRLEIWVLKLAKAMGSKIVHTVHNILPMETGLKYKKVFTEIYDLADRVICHNEQSKTRLVQEFGVAADKISVIPHGPLFADIPRPSVEQARLRLGFERGECVVLWQGIIDYYKGVLFLLNAWKAVRLSGIQATLVIAGAGNQKLTDEIRRKVVVLGIEDSVRLELRFLPLDELSAFFQAADILVYPYSEITTSGALMTVINYGKAMIVSDLPLFREKLLDGKAGLLASYGDIDGLASLLCRLIMHPEERRQLEEGVARLARQQTSWQDIGRMTHECYREALQITKAVGKVASRV
jgi:glycosyltransferase involved in cell wall biosynthesis